MRARVHTAILTLLIGCSLLHADDPAVAHQIRFAEAQLLADAPATELDGIAALAILAHDPTTSAKTRLACMEAIIARHAAAGRAAATADTVDTTLRLFPELESARAFELRLLAGRSLADYAIALPATDVNRPRHFQRAQAYLTATTLIHHDKRADPEVVAEAMYWLYVSYLVQGDKVSAYQIAKRLGWDYPESKWAKMARTNTHDLDFSKIEEQLDAGAAE